jgi:SAM-dependent methyltransferase
MTSELRQRWEVDFLDVADIYLAEGVEEHVIRIREEAALVLSRIAMEHVFASGQATLDPDAAVPEDVAARQPFFFRKRLIEYLDDRGDLVREGSVYRPTDQLVQRANTSEADYFANATESPTLRAIKHFESVAGGVFAGQDSLMLLEETIGAEQTWRTWQFLMVDAGPKKAINNVVARVLDLRLRAGEPIVVFEGGAGLGAALRAALELDGFRERAKNIQTYGFTDVNRTLMRRARDLVRDTAPELLGSLHFDRVDLDYLDEYDDLPYLQDAAADLIIFESVLYDVTDLHQVLTSCRRILKPGGWLTFTFGSRGRPGSFFPCEMFQSTVHSYYRAKLDPPRRVNVGYISIPEWQASLEHAGFPEFRILPDVEHHQKWPYATIVARRP